MSSMGISLYSIKPQFLLILLIIIILATSNYLIWSGCVTKFQITSYPNKIQMYQSNYLMSDKKCETIHIGIVCIGTRTNLLFYTLLKSLYFYRTNPLHFHILADNLSEISINTLFDTWSVSQVSLSLYNANEHILNVSWIGTRHYSGVYGLLKLIFPNIVPTYVSKLIILDSDIVFNGNIIELWLLFNNFNQSQFIGLTENESGFYLSKQVIHWPAVGRGFNTGIILYDLWRMRTISWNDMWYQIAKNGSSTYGPTLLADQDVINAIVKRHREILFEIPCYWNIQLSDNTHSSECYKINFLKVIHWNSPKKTEVINKDGDYFKGIYNRFTEFNGNSLRIPLNYCSTLLTTHKTLRKSQNVCQKFQQMESKKWRTLLLFKIFEYIYVDEDVTYMAHFSYDRLYVLEELLQLWQGPMSLVLYATDSEFQQVIHFLSNVETLKDRKNIGFHVVFRSGEYYPINYLRNIGLKYVYTTYVFLADIDFLPMPNLYSTLRQHIANIQNMNKKALIVPAFESQKYRSRLPRNKRELLYMLKTKEVFPFRYDTWSSGHSATNYTRWKTAHTSYQIKWLSDFEPYVLVSSNVTEYDTIFMGFGWNKVSHIMELHLQGYEFIVLPDVFIIHQPHTPSNDIVRFRRSSKYRRCLKQLKEQFVMKLRHKYNVHY